jgi:AraC-like DNA-binding protein
MFTKFYQPTEALQPLVLHYMLAHVPYSDVPPASVVKPFPPAPEQCLYFYPRGEVWAYNHRLQQETLSARSIVVGPQVSRVDLRFSHDHLVVCVAFRPGGLHRLLGTPMRELLDFSVESELLLGPAVRQVSEQLTDPALSYNQMIALVESFLLQQARRIQVAPRPIDKVLPLLLQPSAAPSLDALADAACLSARQFERNCYERLGIGPKLFARIGRFSRAFRLKDHRPDLDWLSVALLTGYSDYRHLVRDCKEFAGVTPPSLLSADAVHPARVYTHMPSMVI